MLSFHSFPIVSMQEHKDGASQRQTLHSAGLEKFGQVLEREHSAKTHLLY